jgi:hypothetical protein
MYGTDFQYIQRISKMARDGMESTVFRIKPTQNVINRDSFSVQCVYSTKIKKAKTIRHKINRYYKKKLYIKERSDTHGNTFSKNSIRFCKKITFSVLQ